MSWGTCYSGSNNIHMGFPALMSDGRLYANWDAACGMNNALKAKEGIKNNYDYRQYLIKNGSQVMHQNAIAACDNWALREVAYGGHLEVVKVLLEYPAVRDNIADNKNEA